MKGKRIPITPNTTTHIQYLETLIDDAPCGLSHTLRVTAADSGFPTRSLEYPRIEPSLESDCGSWPDLPAELGQDLKGAGLWLTASPAVSRSADRCTLSSKPTGSGRVECQEL